MALLPPDDPGDHGRFDTPIDVNVISGGGTGGLTDAELRATPVNVAVVGEVEIKNDSGNPLPVTGTVTVTDGAGPLTVDGTVAVSNFPASVEVSNDVGNPLPVTGTVTITDGSGPVTVDGTVTANVTSVVSAFTHGQNTDIDSGANEQIVAASNPATFGVLVKASQSNTGTLYIGGSGVTSGNGIYLEPGESITIPIDNANKVYAIASADNQQLSWMAT